MDIWQQAQKKAENLDSKDSLANYAQQFAIPEGLIYLDGNSLGPAPKAAFTELANAAKAEWATGLIRSWNEAEWFVLAEQYGDMLANIIGADSGEVVVCDTTSINIYKALHAGLSLRPERKVIVSEAASFPTDLYITEGVKASRSDIEIHLEGREAETLEALLNEEVAVVLVNHVDYRTGELRDMAAVTKKIHAVGAIAVWDLCHSAGILPVDLNANHADMAVGCGYKYLNGGPGAPAFIYAAKRHIADIQQPLSGWWGHANPFAFDAAYQADAGIRKFLCGTQPILSLRAMKAGLEMYQAIDMQAIRAKSMALTEFFIELVEQSCAEYGVAVLSPRKASERGGQVALMFEHSYAAMQAIIARGVIGDFRRPNIMRFGFSPLYISYQQVYEAVAILHQVLAEALWKAEKYHVENAVT